MAFCRHEAGFVPVVPNAHPMKRRERIDFLSCLSGPGATVSKHVGNVCNHCKNLCILTIHSCSHAHHIFLSSTRNTPCTLTISHKLTCIFPPSLRPFSSGSSCLHTTSQPHHALPVCSPVASRFKPRKLHNAHPHLFCLTETEAIVPCAT